MSINSHTTPLKVVVYGATGYTGFELVKLLKKHPGVELRYAVSGSSAGKNLNQVHQTVINQPLVAPEDVKIKDNDLAFLCLPHGPGNGCAMRQAAEWAKAGKAVIDLGGDYRLRNMDHYQTWYGHTHLYPELPASFVYGLAEVMRGTLGNAKLVANPGCYPTATSLALYPLLKHGMQAEGTLIADAKSGVSGAGRSPKTGSLFVEANENISPYNPGTLHRHVPELQRILGEISGEGVNLLFTPHLVPVSRGLLSTVYAPKNAKFHFDDVYNCYAETYANDPFVRLLPKGQTACMRHAVGTNLCVLSLHPADNHVIICSAIDNLLKGAAGQAVQNMNLMFGFEETEALPC